MRNLLGFAVLFIGLGLGCSRPAPADTFAPGADVTVGQNDGTTVSGRLIEVTPDTLVVELQDGGRTTVDRERVASVSLAGSGSEASVDAVPLAGSALRPTWREVTIPAGSLLRARLETTVGSNISRVESPVRAILTEPVMVDGSQAVGSGAPLAGSVIEVRRSGRVQGRATVALRFDSITVDDERFDLRTEPISRTARGTKKKDATKIGIGTAAGAVIGGIIGGGKGAAIGAGTGAGAGTAVVMSTRGTEVQIPRGTTLTIKLTEPLMVRVKA